MKCAVIILSWNARDELLACVQQVLAQQPTPYVVVVDNASHDGSADRVAADFPQVHLIRNQHNLGFSGGMNAGLRALHALPDPPEIAVLLNQDTLVDAGWLAALSAVFADPNISAAGCKIRYADGLIQHAGLRLDWPRALARHIGWHEQDHGQYDTPQQVEYQTGAALALRLAAVAAVGWLDEGYAPAYFEDVDLCWRLRQAGGAIAYVPTATLRHQESLSLPDELTRSAYYNRGRLRFVLRSYPFAALTGELNQAEIAFASTYAHTNEGRALRWAYAETLMQIAEIVALRQAAGLETPPDAAPVLRELLHHWLLSLKKAVYQRAITCVEAIESL